MIAPQRLLSSSNASWKRLLLFDLFLLSLVVLASRLGAALHEGVGHALVAALLGGQVLEVKVDPLGGGLARVHFASEPGFVRTLLWQGGGMLVNLLTGAAAVGLLSHLGKRPRLALFVSVFALVSVLTPVAYSAIGFYYGVGDPEALATAHLRGTSLWRALSVPWDGHYLWVPFLALSPLASYWVMKPYIRVQQTWFPSSHLLGRVAIALLTLGLVGSLYLALYRSFQGHLVTLDAPTLAERDAGQRVRQAKALDVYERLQKQHRSATEEQIWQMVIAEIKKQPIEVRPDEVRTKTPLQPLVAVLLLSGALGAAWRVGARETIAPSEVPTLSLATVCGYLALAGLVLAFLFLRA
jgi:hypothetical protein